MHTQSAVAKHPHARATYQDVLDAPPHMVAEILEGKLYMNPRPTFEHCEATLILLRRLSTPYQDGYQGPGGFRFVQEPELHLGDHVLVPDGAAWLDGNLPSRKNRTTHLNSSPTGFARRFPPSTRKVDLTEKRDIYARYGVQNLWYLDPDKPDPGSPSAR